MSERTTKIRDCRCPKCGHEFTDATSLEGHQPEPGDFSVCIGCATLLCFAEDMSMRRPTTAELATLLANAEMCEDLSRKQSGIRAFQTLYRRRN